MRPVFWRECIRRQSSIPPRRAPNHHKGDRHLCGGFGVCPDETCQNEPVTRRGNGVGREFGLLNRVPTWATYRLWKTLLSDYGECCCRIMTCATTAYGNVPHERRHGASWPSPLATASSRRAKPPQNRRKTAMNNRREGGRAPFAAVFCLPGASRMQVSRLFGICRAHRDKRSIKPQARAAAFWGVLGIPPKAYSLGFHG